MFVVVEAMIVGALIAGGRSQSNDELDTAYAQSIPVELDDNGDTHSRDIKKIVYVNTYLHR